MRILMLTIIGLISISLQAQYAFPVEKHYLDAKQLASSESKNTALFFVGAQSKSSAYLTEVCLQNEGVTQSLKKNYVSTLVAAESFEGKTLMKKWKLSKVPSIVIIDPMGQTLATFNHGLSSGKLSEALSFYAKKENAGQTANIVDNDFGALVNQWTGFKGTEQPVSEPEPDPVTVSAPTEKTLEKTPVELPVQKPVKEMVKEPASDPMAVISTPSKPETPKIQAAKSGNYFIQAGVFGSEANAKSLKDKIDQLNGGKAIVENISTTEKTLFRVIAGYFDREEDAKRMLNTLESSNIKGIIKANQ